jgi:hypothetical protein
MVSLCQMDGLGAIRPMRMEILRMIATIGISTDQIRRQVITLII